MVMPTFVSSSALGAVSSGNVTPALPAGVQQDDIIFLFTMTNAANTFPTPTNYAIVDTNFNDADSSCAMFWKRAGAGETAPAAFTISGGTALSNSNVLVCRTYAFRDTITTGTPYEIGVRTSTTVLSGSIDQPNMTTTGPDRLLVAIVGIDDDTAFASGPSGSWVAAGTHLTTTTGGDAGVAAATRSALTASTYGSMTIWGMAVTEFWHLYTLALLPGPDPARRQRYYSRYPQQTFRAVR